MQTNNQKISKNKIFIIWGLFIIPVILVFLIILLLALKKQPKTDTPNQHNLNFKNNLQQQQTYNRILNKIEKEVDELTKQQEQNPSLKYPPKKTYYIDGKKIQYIEEFNQDTGKLIKKIAFQDNILFGQILNFINEYNSENGIITKKILYYNNDYISYINEYNSENGKIIKQTKYNDDYKLDYINEYDQSEKLIKKTIYYPDGTIQEVTNY